MQLGRVSARAALRAALLALVCGAPAAHAELRLLHVGAAHDGGGTRVALDLDGEPTRSEPLLLDAPKRLVLDLPGVVNATGQQLVEVGGRDVLRVRLGAHPGFLRVVLDLAPGADAAHRLELGARGLALAFGEARLPPVGAPPPGPSPQPAAPAPAPAAVAPEPDAAENAAAKPIRIYGVELQAGAERDRVLVFAEHAIEAQLVTLDAGSVELRLPGAVLDPTAAKHVKPDVGGAVSDVLAFAPLSKGPPEVRIRIERSAGALPTLTSRGAILAVEFPLPAGARDTGLTLSFEDAELAEVVRNVAKATGTSFMFDDRLQGRVTISVVNRVSKEEAVQILHAALLSKGFAAVPSPGGVWRILPVSDSAGAAPLVTTSPEERRVAPVTTLVRLHNADARDLVGSLAPFAGTEIVAAAVDASNSVILSGSEARLRRYLALVQELDTAQAEELVAITLRHRSAPEIADILLGTEPSSARTGSPVAGKAERKPPFEVWADERTNTVLMRASAEKLAQLRAWLEELDQPPAGQGQIRVLHPLNADPSKLAETLQKLGQGDPGAARNTGSALAEGLAGRSFHVVADVPTAALVVEADAETQAIVRDVVEALDRRPPGIAVDVLVLEITTTRSLALGFDAFLPWGDATDPSSVSAGAVGIQSQPGGVFTPITNPGQGFFRYARSPLVIPIVGPGGIPTTLVVPRDIVQITASDGTVEARTLLRPHLVGISGEEHELVAGDNVPVLVGATSSAGATSDPLTIRNNIERRDVGMLLHVKPTAGQEGDVRLELKVEASRLRTSPDISTSIGPVIEQRKLSAVTRLAHGQVAVLGIAIDDAVVDVEHGVPFLKDIPILGWYARSVTHEPMKRSLVIAVQAGIERSREERLADTMRHRLSFERTLARRGRLAIGAKDGYALLVTTRESEAEAESVASELAAAGVRSPRVVPWEYEGNRRYDVFAGGYDTLAEAGDAAAPIVAEGWKPEVVALPPELSAPAKQR